MSSSHCVIRWWDNFMWTCKPHDHSGVTVVSEINSPEITVGLLVGLLFVSLAGILGSLVLNLIENKIELFFEPVEKRYYSVQVRKRLESMKGHP